DTLGLRDAFMQAFRVRGIVPDGASFFSDTAIAWPMAKDLSPIPNLEFGDPSGLGLTPAEQRRTADALRSYFGDPEVRRQFASLGALDAVWRHDHHRQAHARGAAAAVLRDRSILPARDHTLRNQQAARRGGRISASSASTSSLPAARTC